MAGYPTATTSAVAKRAPMAALVGWILADWAVQPFHTLIVTFLFAPYFTTAVAGDAALGQALWGYAAATAGILIAIAGPVMGAMADQGRRKPWVALSTVGLACAASALWIAKPAADSNTILLVLTAFVIGTVCAELTAVFLNSLMPRLVPPDELGRLSGIAWAVAFTGGLISLILMAGFIVGQPDTGRTLLGFWPLLHLDFVTREGDRLVGPFVAVWLLIFIVPFFLFVPDEPAARKHTASSPLAELWQTLKSLPSMPSMLLFLVARAIYTDGLSAIFVFGGIYGATIFNWDIAARGLFGIVLIVAGVIGAAAGGVLDDKIGSKRVILGSLAVLVIASLGILSVTQSSVLFGVPVAPKVPGSAAFSSTGEQVFLLFAVLVATMAAPSQSASRSLLARLAPPDQTAQFFGLFAFSGKVTAFLAPLGIAILTQLSGSQRLGMSAILIFLVLGLVLMLKVDETKA